MKCVVRMMRRPCLRACSIPQIFWRDHGSMPALGSSRMMTAASPIREMARDSLRFMPPLNVLHGCPQPNGVRKTVSEIAYSPLPLSLSPARDGTSAPPDRVRNVVEHDFAQQLIGLGVGGRFGYPLQRGEKAEVLARREQREQDVVLGAHAEASPDGCHRVVDALAMDEGVSTCRDAPDGGEKGFYFIIRILPSCPDIA